MSHIGLTNQVLPYGEWFLPTAHCLEPSLVWISKQTVLTKQLKWSVCLLKETWCTFMQCNIMSYYICCQHCWDHCCYTSKSYTAGFGSLVVKQTGLCDNWWRNPQCWPVNDSGISALAGGFVSLYYILFSSGNKCTWHDRLYMTESLSVYRLRP